MALATFRFESRYLGGETSVHVALPDRPDTEKPSSWYSSGRKYKCLTLLHGTSGSDSDWIRWTRAELYASERETIVVMPSCLNSEYTDWPSFGTGYFPERFISEELLPMVHSWLPASDKMEDNFLGGLSMGAYGAIGLAARHPGLFSGVIALSGAPRDPERRMPLIREVMAEDFASLADAVVNRETTFGETGRLRLRNAIDEAGGVERYVESSTWEVMRRLKKGEMPKIYMAVGEDDFFFDDVKIFKNYCDQLGVENILETFPGYRHEWRFWDFALERGMEAMGLAKTSDF